ncbi:MAG: hypothetical protein MJA84_03235 [Firmicutes bacterium]|nr:hypothetical protein [Bacillota bacterium]
MDFWGLVVILSILASALVLIIGPLMEVRGKILFVNQTRKPVTRGRFGMGIMLVSAILFVAGLILRMGFSSETVAPIVIGGYALWFVGGIIAVIRNESLKIMVSGSSKATESSTISKEV